MPERLLASLKRGLVFVLSGPGGVGKTTLVNKLTAEFPSIVPSISYTTRPKRAGEEHKRHYNFVSEEEFERLIAVDEFCEYVKFAGHYYGTSKTILEELQKQGKHVILVIDTEGQKALRQSIPHASIFVMPPSIDVLQDRLEFRKTESQEVIEERLTLARAELQARFEYDYIIINDNIDLAYQILRSVVVAESHRSRWHKPV